MSGQPEALRLAQALEYCDASVARQAINELRRLHAENASLTTGYDAARHEIDDLRARVQELGQIARDCNSRRVVELQAKVQELEAMLAAVGAGGVEPLRRHDHFRGVTKMVPVGWAISYDGEIPHALWTEGEGDLLDLEVKRQGGTACKMELYAMVEK